MSGRTLMLIPPTLDEVKKQAAQIKLPEREAEKFFYHWDMVGWKKGKVPVQWKSALQLWRLNWLDWRTKGRVEQEARDSNQRLEQTIRDIEKGKL